MKVSVEKLPTSEAVLEVDVTWDEMEKASQKAYRKLVQKVDVQGFRRGKAPRSLLERKLGKEYIYQEGLDELIAETYRNTLKEYEITPITQPRLEAPTFEMGQPYHFSLTVPIVTPVELGDYRSMHFPREDVSVTSEEVDKELESLRNRRASWEIVERPAAYGDRVTVDLKLTVEGQNVSDLKDNPFELTAERSGIFTGMDEQIVGMQAGESKSFSTTIPTDYSNEKLAEKQADYEVTLHKVEEKHLPALDDEFAEKASDGQYQTLEDLSKAVSDNILDSKKRQADEKLREQAINTLIEQSQFTIHPLLIDEEIEDILHQTTHMLERQHLSMDQYLLMMRKSLDEYKQELRPDAEKRVKRQLALDELAKREKIEVQAEEIEALFNAYAQIGQNLPRTESGIRALAASYLREKALSRLVELTTDPDPDAVGSGSVPEEAEEATVENAQAAALAGEDASPETQAESVQPEEPALATPPAEAEAAEKVE